MEKILTYKLNFSLTTIIFFLLLFLSLNNNNNNNICSRNIGILMVNAQKYPNTTTTSSSTTVGVKVGVILDTDTWLGKIGLSSIEMGLDDFYASHPHYKTRILLNTRNVPNSDIVGAASAAVELLKTVEVQAIIGPLTSIQANFVADLGDKANIPIISFSATSPFLSSIRTPYFVRATLNDSSQVNAISAIVQAFGWRTVVPIYVGDDYGQGIIPFLTDAFQDIDVRVPYRSVIPSSATDGRIVDELYKLKTMQTRVFIVHMGLDLGSRLFKKAKEVGMMEEDYVWIITDGLSNVLSSMDPSVIYSLQGALGVMPYVPATKRRANFTMRWKRKFQQENPSFLNPEMNVIGLRAYDAAVALAMAVEKVRSKYFGFIKTNVTRNLTDLESFGVSTSGPELLRALNIIKFRGLCGKFSIVEGQLQPSVYQIINVINKDGRGIGFWTERYGITRYLNFTNISRAYSASKDNLGPIIWPGDTISPPRGWVVPTSGKRLKIGVPVKGGFSEFVNITRNGNKTNVITGYCIDVFEAVIAMLPYDVSPDYIPFEKSDGTSRGSYDDLVYQVSIGAYDVVVGDVSIVWNRSSYVDFTLPFTESGTSLIVPIKDSYRRKNASIFVKPFTPKLWFTSFCSFVFIGFVIWILEHRMNKDFRGPPSHQVGVMFYFSFSTLVYAHKERVLNNLARFVVIVWVFVVLILTQSYTASLASMLTIEQLNLPVTDMMELVKNRDKVGYQQGSFTLGLLTEIGFHEDDLWAYSSAKECHDLFSNGSIAAAFDETPYARLFHAQYCLEYAIFEKPYRTDGFGFVFPRGSPLTPDVSRAILNVTEGIKMVDIEKEWLQKYKSCPDNSTSSSSNRLGLESFWALFVIVYVVSVLAILIYLAMFLHEHWHILSDLDPQTSLWQKIVILARQHDKNDLTSHVFRRTGGVHDGNVIGEADSVRMVGPSVGGTYFPNDKGPQSQSPTASNNAEANSSFHEEQGTLSKDYVVDQETQVQTNQEVVPQIELAIPPQVRPQCADQSRN